MNFGRGSDQAEHTINGDVAQCRGAVVLYVGVLRGEQAD